MTISNRPYSTLPERPASPADRERVVEALCLHFAADHLTMDSLEGRLALAYEAPTLARLEELISDLQPLDAKQMATGGRPVMAPPNVIPPRGVALAILGGVTRKGSWMVPSHFKAIAIMGGAELDLRDARFGPGVTEIDVFAMWGGVEITVPPGVRVECVGGAILGGFESSAAGAGTLDPNSPILRVSGLAIMGGVEVKVKKPSKKTLERFEQAMLVAGRPVDDME